MEHAQMRSESGITYGKPEAEQSQIKNISATNRSARRLRACIFNVVTYGCESWTIWVNKEKNKGVLTQIL